MRAYLDWNATTPPLPEAVEAMRTAANEAWGNPSSVHHDGRIARKCLEDARAAVGRLVHADPRDVVLTSGGTEANNFALRSAFSRAAGDAGALPRVLVTSRLEHPSIVRVAEALQIEGHARVRWLRVTSDGRVDPVDLEVALAEEGVRLLAMQAVNHETGVVHDLRTAIRQASARAVPVHVDAVQAVGRLDVGALAGASSIAIASHKLRGPKGIGALVTRPGLPLTPILVGGAQERGLRAGTQDPVAAAGFAVAARHAATGIDRYRALVPLRDRLEHEVRRLAPAAVVCGRGERAPHVATFAIPGWVGAELVAALDLEGVSVSSGAACSAGTIEASPVLLAMLGEELASSGIRFSMGESTTASDIEHAIRACAAVFQRAKP